MPVHPAAAAVASAAGDDAKRYALDGGEDFELIAAIAPRAFRYLSERFRKHFGTTLHPVGRLEANPGLRLREERTESPQPLIPAGYDHLAVDA